MRGYFINYRRHDESDFAGRLYDRLAARFGKANVFIDVDSIGLGIDFVDAINSSISQCKVLIVVVGRTWLTVTDDEGQLRLHDPGDYVRMEIETALRRNVRVIPVLLHGAEVPKSAELPDSMASLARRNGIKMSHENFNSDADRLIRTLTEL